MEFSRQEYRSGCTFPPPGDLPNPGIKLKSLTSLALAGRFFTTVPPGKPLQLTYPLSKNVTLCIPVSASVKRELIPALSDRVVEG